jgi:hypothetical protein
MAPYAVDFPAPPEKRGRYAEKPPTRRPAAEGRVSGDDAPMLAGELGVGGDRSRRREVEILLQGQAQRAAGGGELVQAHVAEFRLAETEIAEPKARSPFGSSSVRSQVALPSGVKIFTTGSKSIAPGPSVEGGALGAAVLEEFLALGGSDELHGSIPVWADPSGPFTEQTDRAGSARNRMQLINARSRTDRGSTGRDSGFALARAVRPI